MTAEEFALIPADKGCEACHHSREEHAILAPLLAAERGVDFACDRCGCAVWE